MFIDDLKQERALLRRIQNHHIQKLYAPQNPSGVLLYQKQAKGYRWTKRDLQNGTPVNVRLRKSDTKLIQKLAINLYRFVCAQYIQNQINSLENVIRCYRSAATDFSDILIKNYQPGASNSQWPLGDQDSNYFSEPSNYLEEMGHNYTLADLPMLQLLAGVRNCPCSPADFFRSQSPYRPFLLSYLQNEYEDIIEWYINDFPHNEEYPEQLIYPVKLGFKVRSKSEVLIADRLYEEGILFHYEEQLILTDTDAFADFLTMISMYEKYAWEHFGAMDKEYYFNRARGRILTYLDSNWFPGVNMVTTYETKHNPLTEENVDQKIRWLKNRYRIAFADLPPDGSFDMYDLADYVKLQMPKY